MEGEKHETLTWKFRFLAAAAHVAAFAALQLLPKCCCSMAWLFFYTAVRAAWQELQPFFFLTEYACVGLDLIRLLMGTAPRCSWFPSQPGFSLCCRHWDPGAGIMCSASLQSTQSRIYDAQQHQRASSVLLTNCSVLLGLEMVLWLPEAHHSGWPHHPKPTPEPWFWLLSLPSCYSGQNCVGFFHVIWESLTLGKYLCARTAYIFDFTYRRQPSLAQTERTSQIFRGQKRRCVNHRTCQAGFNQCSLLSHLLCLVMRHPSDAGAPFQMGKHILASSDGDYSVPWTRKKGRIIRSKICY